MEVKQRGSGLGHKIVLFMYKLLGYGFVSFILNFVALYYVFFTPSVKRNMKDYYAHQGIGFTNFLYFKHIKNFALSVFDRFVSRMKPEELSFERTNTHVVDELQDGGVILLSHVGSWATAAHCLGDKFPMMNIVMRESTKESISKVEEGSGESNERHVKVIDLNRGAIAANIQIANALMAKELVALMADRVADERQVVEVEFFSSKVKINKNPFDIATRLKKPLVAIFVMSKDVKLYDLSLHRIKEDTIEEMAQEYMSILEDTMRKYPNQWYNFYDFFKEAK